MAYMRFQLQPDIQVDMEYSIGLTFTNDTPLYDPISVSILIHESGLW